MIWVSMLLVSLFPEEATKNPDEHESYIFTNIGYVLILDDPIKGEMHNSDSPILQRTSFA